MVALMSTGFAFSLRGRWQAALVLGLSTGLWGQPMLAQGNEAGPTEAASPGSVAASGAAPGAASGVALGAASTSAAPAPASPTPDASAPSPGTEATAGRPDALRDVDRRIGDLKDQITRAKARLSLLSERHLRSSAGGVMTTLSQRNQLGPLLRLVRVVYEVDGREVFRREEENGKPLPVGDLPIWDGPLRPGEHTLSATLLYRGNGGPVFSYHDQYTYTVTAAHRFVVNEGGGPRIRVVCREKGNFATTSLDNRPFIEFVADEPAAAKPAADKGADAAR